MQSSYEPNPDHPLTLACPYFSPEEQAFLQKEFREILNGRVSMGPRVAKFEAEFSKYCGTPHGIALSSGTASLEVALTSLGLQPGDEVLVPVQTFTATAMAVHLAGGRPVFTEISEITFCMDFDDALSRVTSRTRGAIVVHFGGLIPARLLDFIKQMHDRGCFVIEDAAHAHGSELRGARAGSFGDAGCFSFYPTKIMTTGEGGMLVTSREDVAQTARSLQNRGLDLNARQELYSRPGRNNRFTEIAAAMGLSQLRCLPEFLKQRRRVARLYDSGLTGNGAIHPLVPDPNSLSSYWRYVTLLNESMDRKNLKEALAADGIAVDWAYDPPVHLQPVFRQLMGTQKGMFPRSESALSRHLCLPIHPRLRECDAEYILERVAYHAADQARAVS